MRGLLLVVAIPVFPIDCWSIEAPFARAVPGGNLPVNGETGVDPFNYQPERLDQPGRPLHLLVLVAASMPLSVEVPGPVPISAASCWPAYSLSCKFSLLARGGSQVTAGPAGQFDAKESGIQDAVVAVSSATECRSVGSPRAAAPGGAFTGHAAGGRLTGAPWRASSPHPKPKPRASRAAGLRLPWTACPGQVWPPTLASCYVRK